MALFAFHPCDDHGGFRPLCVVESSCLRRCDGAMSEATSLHAGQQELRLRLPCVGLIQLTPAEMEVLSSPAYDPATLSPADQATMTATLLQMNQALLVLAPVRADHPSHWTVLSAQHQQRRCQSRQPLVTRLPLELLAGSPCYQQTRNCQLACQETRRMVGAVVCGLFASRRPGSGLSEESCPTCLPALARFVFV